MKIAGSLLSRLVQRLQLVCHPCQTSHNHAKGHTPSKENTWRKNIEEIFMACNKTRSFSGPPTSSKVKYTWKSYLGVSNTSQRSVPLEFDNPPLNLIEITWKQVDMTALGPDSYIWLKNRAMIHISIHTHLCWKVTLQAGNRMERCTFENTWNLVANNSALVSPVCKWALTWKMTNNQWTRGQLTIWPLRGIKVNKSSF